MRNLLWTALLAPIFLWGSVANADEKDAENALRENLIKVTTPLGTDIKFRIGNRPVTKQDGDASYKKETYKNLIDREIELPPGAIRVAPIEDTVEGTIAFPNSVRKDKIVEGLVITFKKGKIENLTANKGEEAVLEELKLAGETGQYFREFALGFNPLLSIAYLIQGYKIYLYMDTWGQMYTPFLY